MKLKLFSAFLLTVCISALGGDEVARPQTNWQPIMGFAPTNAKAYVDANSLTVIPSTKAKFVTGDILISSPNGKKMLKKGKTVIVKSVVKNVLVDCTHGIIAPIDDLYFEVEMPTRKDQPTGGVEYPSDASQAIYLEKASPIYKTFCPVYL